MAVKEEDSNTDRTKIKIILKLSKICIVYKMFFEIIPAGKEKLKNNQKLSDLNNLLKAILKFKCL